MSLTLRSQDAAPAPANRVEAEVAADGRFAFEATLAEGEWEVDARGLLLPERQLLHLRGPRADVEVVIVPPDEVGEIRGVVVDDAGQPVQGAAIEPPDSGPRRTVRSDAAGNFVMQQWRGVDTSRPIALTARRDGYEPASSAEPVAWGSTGLRFVLRPAAALQVHVVRAVGGEPVEEYGLRVVPRSIPGMLSLRERELRDGWQHPGGVTQVRGLRPGEHLVHVETRREAGLALAAQWLEIPERPPLPVVTIPLLPGVRQVVRLVDGQGEPVAGSEVQLIDPDGAPLEADTWVRDFESSSMRTSEIGWMADKSVADAAGEAVVRGAAGHPYALRIQGGEHQTLLMPDVTLSGEPLVCVVDRGATLRLRFRPLQVLAAWRQVMAQTGQHGARQWRPGVHLSRSAAGGRLGAHLPMVGSKREEVDIDHEGVAELTGVAAGRWDVWLHRPNSVVAGQRVEPSRLFLGAIEVPSGGVHELGFDVTGQVLGAVAGRVMVDDQAHAQRGWLRLERAPGGTLMDGRPAWETCGLPIDEQGRFAGRILAGTWRGSLRIEGPAGVMVLPTRPEVVVRPGGSTEVSLRAFVQRARLRIVDSRGEPRAGVRLQLRAETARGPVPAQVSTTDAQGFAAVRGASGQYSVRTRIRSLQSPEANQAYYERLAAEHDGDHDKIRPLLDAVVVHLGTVTLPGEAEQVLVLPADWDR